MENLLFLGVPILKHIRVYFKGEIWKITLKLSLFPFLMWSTGLNIYYKVFSYMLLLILILIYTSFSCKFQGRVGHCQKNMYSMQGLTIMPDIDYLYHDAITIRVI